jgi:GT2 family glycosyltransferase
MWRRFFEWIFPVGTKRKHFLGIVDKSLRLMAKDGSGSFFLRLKKVYRLRNVHYISSRDVSIYDETDYKASMKAVDIIVPVYNGFEIVKKCLMSIFSCTLDIPYRVIIVDDSSTDSELEDYLDHVTASQENVLLIRNEENLGFVSSINKALSYSEGDVVIFNSDAFVTRDWLRKLHACAYGDEKIGTVTPLSNNADIFSVPEFCKNNTLPPNYGIQEFASVVEKAAAENGLAYHEVPVGVGFCMYIKRVVLNEIGIFDEAFGRGYGEEIDFCLRASSRGYYHVVCPFVFVFHVGTASFGIKPEELIARNVNLLIERYPDYRERISTFIMRNPLLPVQKSIYKNINYC